MRTSSLVWITAVATMGTGCGQGVIKWSTQGDGGVAGSGGVQVGHDGPLYESDHPGQPGPTPMAAGVDDAASGGSSTGSAVPTRTSTESSSKDAARAIEEADILKMDGTRLYAFSRTGGLSVVDIAIRDQLRLLGTWQAKATPFELYVRNGVVVGLFTGWGKYVQQPDGTTSWVTTSEVVALDTRDPTSIRALGTYDLPGDISDSRIVGDVLYAVAYQNGYCWNCGSSATTTVVSLNLHDPQQIGLVDSLSFAEALGSYSWQRSVTVTPERMYVAGPVYGSSSSAPSHSTVQVVDITDATGRLALGTSIEVAGQIDSRWQMDESDHVLRVISQPGSWDTSAVPVIQTFSVPSSNVATALGTEAMTLPRPERLQSVRFDGPRAYAITTERVDPLFTIDLADPSHPHQMGALEMPGWIYFMVPHGDRLLGLGYDRDNQVGSLTVSLFNVSNLAAPTMLDRVNFGGNWGSLPEDQDRIHKAFTVLDDLGLIAVPYGGWRESTSANGYSCGSQENAVQLIDWQGDDLVLRGAAPQKGQARRAIYHDERLFTVSEERVETFDITNRDQPLPKASLPLSLRVDRTLAVADYLVRFQTDYYSGAVSLEVVPASEPESRVPLGSLDLASALFPEVAQAGVCARYYDWNEVPAFANGTYVYLVLDRSRYDRNAVYAKDQALAESQDTQAENETEVAVIDISRPEAPRVAGVLTVAAPKGYSSFQGSGYYYDSPSIVAAGAQVAQKGSTIVVQRRAYEYTTKYSSITAVQTTDYSETALLDIFDLSNPSNIVHQRLDLGSATGFSGVQFAGDVLVGSHWLPSPTTADKIRFYLHRVNCKDPSKPVVLSSVNVPGSLLQYDPGTDHALLVDYVRRMEDLGTPSQSTPTEKPLPAISTSTGSTPVAKVAADTTGPAGGSQGDQSSASGGSPNAGSTVIERVPEPYEICYSQHPNASFDWQTGVCTWYDRMVNLVALEGDSARIVDARPFPEGGSLRQTAFGHDRVFLVADPSSTPYRTVAVDSSGKALQQSEPVLVRVLSGVATNRIVIGETVVAPDSPWGWSGWLSAEASGQRALLGESTVTLIDATDPMALQVRALGDVQNWPQHTLWLGNRVVLSLGDYGVQVIDLR